MCRLPEMLQILQFGVYLLAIVIAADGSSLIFCKEFDETIRRLVEMSSSLETIKFHPVTWFGVSHCACLHFYLSSQHLFLKRC